jgi:ABC-type branched-subunit amino acid transport system ATPase component/ABC-type branched-subunit amino acid transport system permease subunit
LLVALVALSLPLLVVPGSPTLAPQLAWSADRTSASLATFAMVFAVVALAFATLVRLAGLPSVALGALWGVGAYTAAILTNDYGWTFLATLPLAALVPAAVAAIIGVPTFRTSGVTFLVITIVLGEFIVLVLTNAESLTNGTFGLDVVGANVDLGPLDLSTPRDRYFVGVAMLYATLICVWVLVRSRVGRRLALIRDNEPLARSVGLDPRLYKLAIFAITAALAGSAGQLYLYQQRAITPDLFGAYQFIPIILMAVLGGVDSIAGPIIGAYLVAYAPSWLSGVGLDDPNTQLLVYGSLLLVLMAVAPGGLTGLVRRAIGPVPAAGERADRAPPTPEIAPGAPVVPLRRPVAPAGAPILAVRDLSKRFGAVRALDDVSVSIGDGEILGVIGPNGSGKTTLFNCISGFTAYDGRIEWKGRLLRMPAPQRLARRGLVRTFQQASAFPSLSPRAACARVVELHRSRNEETRLPTSADALIAFCGLAQVADRPTPRLSYGHLRLLGIALALAVRPTLLMLDEPAAGLNDTECAALRQVLENIRAAGVTLMVVDHDMPFLLPLCDRVVVLDAGRVVADGDPNEVTRDPDVVAAYLGERFAAPVELAREEP